MPDLANFSVVRNGTVSLPAAPTWRISGLVIDSKTGAVLRDFTGANAVDFPQVLGTLTQAQQDELVQSWVLAILSKRFGLF